LENFPVFLPRYFQIVGFLLLPLGLALRAFLLLEDYRLGSR
jgi:hypothetical protein